MAAPKLQLLSRTIYDTDGTTVEWDFNFSGGYLLPTHVKAYHENEFGFRTEVVVTEAMLTGPYKLRISPAIAAGSVLVIYRSTPKDAPMVDFTDRGTVSETSLDTMAKQAVFVAAEAADEVNTVDWNKIMEAATEADASAQAAAASATAASVTASTTAAAASANAAAVTAARNEVSASRDAIIAAWASSTAPTESLSAISQLLHVGTIVKSIVYDTSNDSDLGEWRKRCQHTSWYQEAIQSGKWLGQKATAVAAWATVGAATGDFFQNSTDGKYYALGASSPSVTEVFRGNMREFPAVAGVVVEANRVVIYDLATAGCPMWMVFNPNAVAIWFMSSRNITSAAVVNGAVYLGCGGNADRGVCVADFIRDSGRAIGLYSGVNGVISGRNTWGLPSYVSGAVGLLGAYVVNDVAITVLEGAPTDPATGLPVPTIVVGTAGGVSVIKHDGTVVNSTVTNSVQSVQIYDTSKLAYTYSGVVMIGQELAGIAAGFNGGNWVSAAVSDFSVSYGPKLAASSKLLASGGSDSFMSLTQLHHSAIKKGVTARVSTGYTSGYQVGDSRLAALADTVEETVTAPELVTNGTFTTDTSGWSPVAGSTLGVSGGQLVVTQGTAGSFGQAWQNITGLTVGKTYKLYFDIIAGSYSTATVQVNGVTVATAPGTGLSWTFTATATSAPLILAIDSAAAVGQTIKFDNVSLKLADADRSAKNNGLNIIGTLTKTAVAAGAQLVAYSGFSASNYLTQPYTANLDFGTGDFCAMGWMNVTESIAYMFDRGGANGRYAIYASTTSLGFGASAAGSLYSQAISIAAGWHFIAVYRVSGVIYAYIDGTLVYSGANTANVNNAAGSLYVGVSYALGQGAAGVSLLRLGSTAPSADQIAKIYRDELALFQPGAQCTLAGSFSAVTAMAYDKVTDLLHVVTSWGRSAFNGLLRVASEATVVGSPTSVSAYGDVIITGGTNARAYAPSLKLRDELRRKAAAAKAYGPEPVFQDYSATASQTTFVAPKGFKVKAAYVAGTLKQLGTGKDYTLTDDGFQQSVVFATGLSVNTWVSFMLVRV